MPLITGHRAPTDKHYRQALAADRALYDALGPDGYAAQQRERIDYYRGLLALTRKPPAETLTPQDNEFEPLFD